MDQIEPYRQIVQLQAQIVRISRRNNELRKRCEELEEALSLGTLEVPVEEAPALAPAPRAQHSLWPRARLRASRALSVFSPLRWLRV
jgi:cell division protein FtsB